MQFSHWVGADTAAIVGCRGSTHSIWSVAVDTGAIVGCCVCSMGVDTAADIGCCGSTLVLASTNTYATEIEKNQR